MLRSPAPFARRSSRALGSSLAAVLLASLLVVGVAPTPAAAASSVAVDQAHTALADRLPLAFRIADALVAEPGEPSEGETTISGRVEFPATADLAAGRTLVVAYQPGGDVTAPLGAAAVAADGTYSLVLPIGEVALAVLSEGRAVFDLWGDGVTTPAEITPVPLTEEGLIRDFVLEPSSLVSGSVTVPAGVQIGGARIAVGVYPVGGAGSVPSAAGYVSDTGGFAIGGLAAGTYRIVFLSAATGAVSEWWNDATGFATAKQLTVGDRASVSGVNVALSALRILDTAVPTISGSAVVGQTVKAAPGAWTSGAAVTYQWFAGGVAIPKAVSASLAIGADLVGKKLTVAVTGKKTGYASASKTSTATAVVVRPLTTRAPVIAGSTITGQTLKATAGAWTSGTKLSYQWYVGGVEVAKATTASLVIPASARGKTVTVRVTGTKSGYATASRTSAATASVKGVLSAVAPRISGSTKVGQKLTAVPGAWTKGTAFAYQWYANGKAISGAVKSTLTIGAGLVKSKITVKVTGTQSGYVTASKTSAATAAVSYPSRTTPASTWNCPSWAPIKGNANSGIYHVPSGAYYKATKPEECFSSESAAVSAGYRKSKR